MRVERGDILTVIAVLALPLGFVLSVPAGAFGFVGAAPGDRSSGASAAIVFLDRNVVAGVMREVKSLPRSEGNGRVCADLLTVDLPDEEAMPMMSVSSRRRPDEPSVVGIGMPSFLPSRRAAPPVRIEAEKDRDDLPFSRSELLELN